MQESTACSWTRSKAEGFTLLLTQVEEDTVRLLLPFLLHGVGGGGTEDGSVSPEYRAATLMVLTQLCTVATLAPDFLEGGDSNSSQGSAEGLGAAPVMRTISAFQGALPDDSSCFSLYSLRPRSFGTGTQIPGLNFAKFPTLLRDQTGTLEMGHDPLVACQTLMSQQTVKHDTICLILQTEPLMWLMVMRISGLVAEMIGFCCSAAPADFQKRWPWRGAANPDDGHPPHCHAPPMHLPAKKRPQSKPNPSPHRCTMQLQTNHEIWAKSDFGTGRGEAWGLVFITRTNSRSCAGDSDCPEEVARLE